MSDVDLIRHSLAGKKGSWNTLIGQWQDPIYNFCLRYLGNAEAAKEVCQKTWIRVHAKLGQLQNHDRFKSWLFQIAVNLCRDELRQRKRFTDAPPEGDFEKVAGDGPEPFAAAARPAVVAILNHALQQISDTQRAVVVLKIYHDQTFVLIGESLGISPNTAKGRFYDGLKIMAKFFKAKGLKLEDIQL